MRKFIKKVILLLFSNIILLFSFPAFATEITNIVVFGDSLSDRGYTENQGGFNRYSNGQVWPEYLAQPLCKECLQDFAWGGARSDYANFNGFKWSGVLWQIKKTYKLNTDPNKTLYIIWIGGNDLVGKHSNGAKVAENVNIAINKLANIGAKNIVVLTLPDFTIMPGLSNKKLPEYKKFASVNRGLKKQINLFNKKLKNFAQQHSDINLQLIDISEFFASLPKNYKNTKQPWLQSYHYPDPNGYMWWDAFHLMTSAHERIANYLGKELKDRNFELKTSSSSITCHSKSETDDLA